MINLILIGAQGSGKGTQAGVLIQRFGIQQLSSGDLFRDAIKQGTALGMEAKHYMSQGNLVPDTITIKMILEALAAPLYANGVILDGFPRTRDQAQALDAALPTLHRHIDKAIYLRVPREILEDRLLNRFVCTIHQHIYNTKTNPPQVEGICDIDGSPLIRREDDEPAAIQRRLTIFFEQTIQVVHYYRTQNKLIEVDGNLPIEAVTSELIAAIGM